MMINDCYRSESFVNARGLAQYSITGEPVRVIDQRFLNKGNKFLFDDNTLERQVVGDDISCPIADSILNACNDIIDASQYIGVTFDIRKGIG